MIEERGKYYESRPESYAEQPKVQRAGYSRESYAGVMKPEMGSISVKPRTIVDELVDLQGIVSNLHDYMSRLEERTLTFRRPCPVECDAVKEELRTGSELREEIKAQNNSLIRLRNRMSELLESLDV